MQRSCMMLIATDKSFPKFNLQKELRNTKTVCSAQLYPYNWALQVCGKQL